MTICEKMDNYVIQDIIDYCDKVLFEMFKGKYKTIFYFIVSPNIVRMYLFNRWM